MARRVKFVDGKRVDLGPLKASHPPQTFTIEDDPFKGACLHAARTGDASGIIRLLREHHPLDEWDRDMLADLLEFPGNLQTSKRKSPPQRQMGCARRCSGTLG